jgi:hypothetical protein
MSQEPQITLIRRQLPVRNTQDVLVDDQDLNHIISAIKKYHGVHRKDYDGISEEFWTGDPETTAKQLFNFNKKYVKYHVEPESDQTIKSPGRIISEGYGDCKHYSSFIAGVVDSLNRKGYPIEAHYKFVSDDPGRDVHHVFAVVRGSGKEMWVDPVLSSFDERPTFHNAKDVFFNNGVGRLTYLAGTDAGVGKKKHHHHLSFKDAIHKFGKGLSNDIKDVTHIGLKVSLSAARNALLALLDVNAFNLATRFREALTGPHAGSVKQKWHDVGGNPKKLVNAVNNGYKHKEWAHHQAPAKRINGPSCGDCIGMGAEFHSRWITTHPEHWANEYAMHHHRRHHHHNRRGTPYQENVFYPGPRQGVSGRIGLEPVTTTALITLASGLVAAFSKYLHMTPDETKAMTDGAKRGVMDITQQAADADQSDGDAKADALTALTKPAAGADSTMSINTGLDSTGNPQVTVQDVNHPALQNAGSPNGGAAADVTNPGPNAPTADAPATPGGGDDDTPDAPEKTDIVHSLESGLKKNSKKIMIFGGLTIVAAYALPKLLHPKKRR